MKAITRFISLQILIFLLTSWTIAAAAEDIIFLENFENGWNGWSADNGVWEVGTPTAGPSACHSLTNCAGTNLSGKYPPNVNSRLISPSIILPTVTGNELILLRFWEWHQYAVDLGETDRCQVQIQTYDSATNTWSSWQDLGSYMNASSPAWSVNSLDLTALAGKKVRLAFYHIDTAHYMNNATAYGIYIDNIEVVKKLLEFNGDFENGWGDWWASNGVWEVGTPTAGPSVCHTGSSCACTILGGNYPAYTTSGLLLPINRLPTVTDLGEIHLRFWDWHQYAGWSGDDDRGQMQIRYFDEATQTWSDWLNIGEPVRGPSTVWSLKDIDLTAYSDKQVSIQLLHIDTAHYMGNATAYGWCVDDVEISNVTPPVNQYSVVQSIGTPDLNGNGTSDEATLVRDITTGGIQVWIRDGATKGLIKKISYGKAVPIALALVPDLPCSGNGKPEIAVLYTNATTGAATVAIRDTSTGALINTVAFGNAFAFESLSVLQDTDNNTVPELAVLRITVNPYKRELVLKDACSDALVRTINLP